MERVANRLFFAEKQCANLNCLYSAANLAFSHSPSWCILIVCIFPRVIKVKIRILIRDIIHLAPGRHRALKYRASSNVLSSALGTGSTCQPPDRHLCYGLNDWRASACEIRIVRIAVAIFNNTFFKSETDPSLMDTDFSVYTSKYFVYASFYSHYITPLKFIRYFFKNKT